MCWRGPAERRHSALSADPSRRQPPSCAPRPDAMLGEIAFDHPLFASFAAAQFNDFTKIHFWKYRRIDGGVLKDARVVARFDTRDPAIIEKAVGKGRLVVLLSGWQPADSQLARSSKFVPFMLSLLEVGRPRLWSTATFVVGARVPLPPAADAGTDMLVHAPGGRAVKVAAGAGFFTETEQPGVYTIDTSAGGAAVRGQSRSCRKQDIPVTRRNTRAARLPAGQPDPADPRP